MPTWATPTPHRGRRRGEDRIVARRDRRGRRRVLPWVAGVVVLALAGGAAAAYETGRLDEWVGDGDVPPPPGAPVPGYTAPTTPTPGAIARTAPSPRPAPACVSRALKPELAD